MKNFLLYILISTFIVLCGALFSPALGSDYNVTVSWDMEETSDLFSFSLRLNGDNATQIEIPGDTQTWTGVMDLDSAENLIDIRACDEAGQVGPWSDSAGFNPPPKAPSITFIVFVAETP